MKFAAKILKVNEFTKFFDNKVLKIIYFMATSFNSQECQREFDRYRKKVARLNAYIEDVIKKVGNHEVYLDKSSTIVSAPASVWPIEEVKPESGNEFCEYNGMPSLEFRQRYQWPEYSKDGITRKEEFAAIRIVWQYDLESDEWYAEYHGDSFDFEEDLRYTKKCVRNGLRFWQSEDPDRFLEKDDDEEGGE